MRILGISCDYHDAAAALVIDGDLEAAAEQERFSRIKHDPGLPGDAVASCLAQTGISADDIDVVVFHEKPLAVLDRVITSRQRRGPAGVPGFAREMPDLISRNLMVGYRLERLLTRLGARSPVEVRYLEHHLSHAAAAFLPSPFPSAAILTVDGIGEWATATVGHGSGTRVDLLAEQRYPHSLGLLYSLATRWCGFAANDGEYKLMGLAPFGTASFRDGLAEVVRVLDDGSLDIDQSAVRRWGGDLRSMTKIEKMFGGPPRRPDEALDQRHADIARTVQDLVEDAVSKMATHAQEITGEQRLCLAGGVALNCVANGRLLADATVEDLWVQPAAGDSGSAIGAALWWAHNHGQAPRHRPSDGTGRDGMHGAQLGPSFEPDDVAAWLTATGVDFERFPDPEERCELVAQHLADGEIVGWFEGRMEIGPRALGHRSILADPRSKTLHRDLNSRVKGRESFRPFAPAVPWERAQEWFEIDRESPYMLRTCMVREDRRIPVDPEPRGIIDRARSPRSEIPACTHVDGSARVQTVDAATSPVFHRLLTSFAQATGCPVLLNTSFNRAGEPIVCTPDQALATARRASLDLLVLEDCLVRPGLDPL